MGSFLAHAFMAIKRAIRPLVPDSLVARFRTPVRPGWARTNVDIIVDENPEIWMRATPDTYRVVKTPHGSAGTTDCVLEEGKEELEAADRNSIRTIMATHPYGAAIMARTVPPRINRGSYEFPTIEPIAIGVRPDLFVEIGGRTPHDDDLTNLLFRIFNAGKPIALIPRGRPTSAGPIAPTTPITRSLSVVIMAGVPLHDVGGGFRGAQLARQFAKSGAHVTYLYEYDSGESVDLGIRVLHPNVEELRTDWFDPGRFAARVQSRDRLVIVEFPHVDIVKSAIELTEHGYQLVYDVIDDWSDRSLGGMWWSHEYEDALLRSAGIVTASAPALVERVRSMAPQHVPVLVPNAVNPDVFGGDVPGIAEDIPHGDGPLFSYHGSLYGDWLDWEAVRDVALAFPTARLMMIGDERKHPAMPDNVHFMGLRAQDDLPRYLAAADVSLIPFKVNATTHAVSPLKAFEAMAMGVVIAAPPLDSLEGLDGVYTDINLVSAVEKAMAGTPPDALRARQEHDWFARMRRILDAAGLPLPTGSSNPAVVARRVPTIYAGEERLVGFSSPHTGGRRTHP
ncbi:MAG: glycosyltransferase [Acidimicrobiia bacterium]|nr:glycosyltransferase [Acidimicrobiia bacterium]